MKQISINLPTQENGERRPIKPNHQRNGSRQKASDKLRLRGISGGPLFLPLTKAGHLIPKRLTTESVAPILVKRGKDAGVETFSCHDLRRSFITHLLEAGADLATVQKIAGHKQFTTALLYDRRGEEGLVKAAELLRVPVGQ